MAERTPRAPADAEARQVLELLRNSWMLALRADGKSAKTLKTYRESADQLIGFLASPPPLPEETADLVDSAPPVTGPGDITATHLRAFMSHLLALHKPATANNRYRGLQQWFRWMASEDEMLMNMATLVQGAAELRNAYGTGHGKSKSQASYRLEPRHARLAVGAAATLGVFLYETHEARE